MADESPETPEVKPEPAAPKRRFSPPPPSKKRAAAPPAKKTAPAPAKKPEPKTEEPGFLTWLDQALSEPLF